MGISSKELEKYDTAIELEHLAEEELFKILKIFRDIDFANGKAIDMLIGYKLNELTREEGKFYKIITSNLDIINEVVREYHSGSVDPVK